MSAIILTEEQMEVLRQAVGPVVVCDQHGEALGTVDPDRRYELVNEIQPRTDEDRLAYSSAHVTALLKHLEKMWAREGRFDAKRLKQIVDEFNESHDGD